MENDSVFVIKKGYFHVPKLLKFYIRSNTHHYWINSNSRTNLGQHVFPVSRFHLMMIRFEIICMRDNENIKYYHILYNNSSYFFRVLREIWQLVLSICCYFLEMIRLENLNSNIAVLMILFKFWKSTLISNAYRKCWFITNKNTILKLFQQF